MRRLLLNVFLAHVKFLETGKKFLLSGHNAPDYFYSLKIGGPIPLMGGTMLFPFFNFTESFIKMRSNTSSGWHNALPIYIYWNFYRVPLGLLFLFLVTSCYTCIHIKFFCMCTHVTYVYTLAMCIHWLVWSVQTKGLSSLIYIWNHLPFAYLDAKYLVGRDVSWFLWVADFLQVRSDTKLFSKRGLHGYFSG